MDDEVKNNFHEILDGYQEEENQYFAEEEDIEILKIRNAHFAKDFSIMHAFYQKDDARLDPKVTLERITYLAEVEAKLDIDLAKQLLSESDWIEIAEAKKAYETLSEIYEKDNPNPLEKAIADLILTEDDHAEQEIRELISYGNKASYGLIKIIETEKWYNPLFPGYGYAPQHAAICLGKLQEQKAIAPLFHLLSKQTLVDESTIAYALKSIGNEAKAFLLRVIDARPITKDSTHAAFALSSFCPDEEIARHAIANLTCSEVEQNTLFSTYLVFLLEGLSGTNLEQAKKLVLRPKLKEELDLFIQSAQKRK